MTQDFDSSTYAGFMMPGEVEGDHITHEPDNAEAWVCVCGNMPHVDGFCPCDEDGNEIEPTPGSGWDGLYFCARCSRIVNDETLEIHGFRVVGATDLN